MYMSQMNLNILPEFAQALDEYMRLRKHRNKSEAIRAAVEEALQIARREERRADFSELIGAGKIGKENPKPKFKSDNDLW